MHGNPRPIGSILILAIVLLATGTSGAELPPSSPPREWTLPDIGPAQAVLETFDGKTASLKLANGQRKNFPAEVLGEADRQFLEEWLENRPVVIPDSVGVDSSKIKVEVVSENEQEAKFVYRTEHFEFTCEGRLTQNLLADVARNFEATHELVKALPWGIRPEPEEGDRFRALLVRSPEHYREQGGPENSGGVYFRSRRLFIIPFESLGIRSLGKSYSKSSDYRSDTLVHELTHQMMHSSLELLPTWVIEGTAEYTNILPLRFGVFRISSARNGLRTYLDHLKTRGGIPEPYPMEKLLTISHEQWGETLEKNPEESHRLYFTSYLLVNYFMHMDGKGDGARFVKYMRAVAKARREVEDYEKAVAEFRKLPDVKNLPDGRYRWPDTLTHPAEPPILSSPEKRAEFEKTTLDILLDGRSVPELAEEIRAAYRRAGLRS